MATTSERGPQEIAEDVFRLEIGRGIRRVNVYLVRSGDSWSLIDTAWASSAPVIRAAASHLFGVGAVPASILLTHVHPDHCGSALELARTWNRPVTVHPAEMPLTPGGIIDEYANPLDRWLIAPILRLMPRSRVEALRARGSLEHVAEVLPAAGDVPGLARWRGVPTPGHTPGHVAFFRERDRVLITGDAILTVDLTSLPGLLLGRTQLAGPPRISTWRQPEARSSVAVLADLEPSVLASGHGTPMAGPDLPELLRSFRASRCGPA
ncbi:MAG: MBL fold metallo-hydrolase [Dactylosporangium sp.]|nr:MBL fold metallo-hydrolase [Dactylosporangium sp.]